METWPKKEEADGSSAVGGQDAPTGTAASPMLHSVADFYRSQPVLDRRVHILGVGNVGSFIAHSIRGIPNPPPVTLLFPSWDRLNAWQDSEQRLSLVTEGDTEMRSGYGAELAIPRIRYHGKEVGLTSTAADDSAILEGESSAPISSLIVCSKAPVVLQGLSAVKHRLTRDSVILFLQNGMGIVDAVSRELFPDPATRPHYMLGINSHGMHSADTSATATPRLPMLHATAHIPRNKPSNTPPPPARPKQTCRCPPAPAPPGRPTSGTSSALYYAHPCWPQPPSPPRTCYKCSSRNSP
jgi:2-dehydropantoate 2-reductase